MTYFALVWKSESIACTIFYGRGFPTAVSPKVYIY